MGQDMRGFHSNGSGYHAGGLWEAAEAVQEVCCWWLDILAHAEWVASAGV